MDVQKNRGKEKTPLSSFLCFLAKHGITYKQNKREEKWVFGLPGNSVREAINNESREKLSAGERASHCNSKFFFFSKTKEIKNLRRRREIYFLFFGEKINFLCIEGKKPSTAAKNSFYLGIGSLRLCLSFFGIC